MRPSKSQQGSHCLASVRAKPRQRYLDHLSPSHFAEDAEMPPGIPQLWDGPRGVSPGWARSRTPPGSSVPIPGQGRCPKSRAAGREPRVVND